jgi:poly-gamma-glutamate capsule biosynthesis protein CapA/YwtB (metallophosphatase superfamily)
MLGRLVGRGLGQRPGLSVWGDTLPLLAAADVRICNLECAFTLHSETDSLPYKEFRFRSDPSNVATLHTAGIDAVSLANNHVGDFGDAGLVDTLMTLDRARIAHAGAGTDLESASAAAVVHTRTGSVAMLACTDNEPGWAAGRNRPGVRHVPVDLRDRRARAVIEDVAQLRPEVDVVVVSLHWGPNWDGSPPHEHIAFAHALVDAGADIVFGHSPHVPRGVEVYGRRAIIYSAGDFIDDYAVDPLERNDWSFLFIVDLDPQGVRCVLLHPVFIEECAVHRARGTLAATIADRVARRCVDLGTPCRWSSEAKALIIAPPIREHQS